MTIKMIKWQMEKVRKMQKLNAEILEGIEESLDYISALPEKLRDLDELALIRKMVDNVGNNIKMCGELICSMKAFITTKKEDIKTSHVELRDDLIKRAFHTVEISENSAPFVSCYEIDSAIAKQIEEGRSFIFYEIDDFGVFFRIMWRYENITGASKLLTTPTFEELCDVAKDILVDIAKGVVAEICGKEED